MDREKVVTGGSRDPPTRESPDLHYLIFIQREKLFLQKKEE